MHNSARIKAVEAILLALSASCYFNDFVVRGSVSSQDWMSDYKRPFHDLDLLYLPSSDLSGLATLLTKVLLEAEPLGLIVHPSLIRVQELWKESIAPGIRMDIPFIINHESSELQIDIAVGDPLCRLPIEKQFEATFYPHFLIRTVILEIAVAWKFHGLFEQVHGPWQSKTLWDLYVFCRFNTLDKIVLKDAIHEAFLSRLDPIEIIKRLLYGNFGQSKHSKKQWDKDLLEAGCIKVIPLADVITFLKHYFIPIMGIKNDNTLLNQSEVVTFRIKKLRALRCDDSRKKLNSLNVKFRVLPKKAYSAIPHIRGSRLGKSERCIDENKRRMLTETVKNVDDLIIVQEKLDGSCVCAYRKGNEIVAVGREGDLAQVSPNESRRLWADWVEQNEQRFLDLLKPGERAVGEWLAMAHGTRYTLEHEPFVLFDLFSSDNVEIAYDALSARASTQLFTLPKLIHSGGPCSLVDAISILGDGYHGAIDRAEGLVWRLERNGRVLFKAKYVSPEKVDGCLLTEVTGNPSVWNWPL
ncbi:RNA ligase family protein [bacterium]|nr:RNA ligase family protein [bacterium]